MEHKLLIPEYFACKVFIPEYFAAKSRSEGRFSTGNSNVVRTLPLSLDPSILWREQNRTIAKNQT
jgi:hypothetical protein